MLDNCDSEENIRGAVLGVHFNLLNTIFANKDVADARVQAEAAGVPFIQILLTVLSFLPSLFTGGTIDWAGIIAAILALINPPTPVPINVTKAFAKKS